MLDRCDAIEGRVNLLCHALERDASSWQDWSVLLITVPQQISAIRSRACLEQLTEVMLQDFNFAEGYVGCPDAYRLVTIGQNLDRAILSKFAQKIVKIILAELDAMPIYQVFNLNRDVNEFMAITAKSFGLDLGSPQPWSSPSHIIKTQQFEGMNRVMLVEDDPVTRWLVRTSLKDSCQLATASTAQKAIELYISYQPDVVFLDLGLPDRHGHEVLDIIMAHDPHAQVVMFTQACGFDSMIESISRGACGFISKPFYPERFMQYLQVG
jgi:CheY-like chemotaxis protein